MLNWNEREATHREIIRTRGFPKEHKVVKLFCVAVASPIVRSAFQQLPLPFGYLVRVDIEVLLPFRQCLIAFERRQHHHLGFK